MWHGVQGGIDGPMLHAIAYDGAPLLHLHVHIWRVCVNVCVWAGG